ncbi:MAG: YqaJ viral recombinase family protein [Cyanobacteria bacterium J06649_11]
MNDNKLFHLLKRTHTGAEMKECGLFSDAPKPFIGASPDRIFECKCHGKVCIEIKCPYSIRNLSPLDKDAHLAYLDYSDKGTSLKKTHTYYTAYICQLQMGVTKIRKMLLFYLHLSWTFIE